MKLNLHLRAMMTETLGLWAPAAFCLALALAQTISPRATHADDNPSDETSFQLYRATLNAAEKSLRLHEVGPARQWLNAAPQPYRGWEWSHLLKRSDESEILWTLQGPSITALDVSADGQLLATADSAGQLRLWRLADMQPLAGFDGHEGAVYSVRFSPDGSQLVTVSRDVTSRVWDVASGREVSRIELENPGVAAATFSPDGSRVATCSWLMEDPSRQVHGVVWIWEATSGRVIQRELVGEKPLDSIAWSAETLVVGSWDGLVHVLDHEGQPKRTITLDDLGIYNAVISVAVSADGQRVAAGSKDRTARIWQIDDGQLLATCRGHDGFVNEVYFSSGDKRLVTASVDGTIRIWDAQSGLEQQVLHGHMQSVDAIALDPERNLIYSGSRDGTLRRWDSGRTFGGKTAFALQPEGTYSTVFSPQGAQLYIANYNGQVKIVDALGGEVTAQWPAHESSCNALALSSDGSRLLTCSWDRTGRVWDTASRSIFHTLQAEGGVYHCDLSSSGSLAALCVGNTVEIWDAQEGQRLGICQGHLDSVRCVAFEPTGAAQLATASADQTVRIWTVDNCQCVAQLQAGEHAVNCVAFSPDGQLLAAGDTAGRVTLWDPSTWEMIRQYKIADAQVQRLAFSPDGQRLAAGADALTLIDPRRQEVLLRLTPQNDTIWHLAFSPDGQRLASCTTSGSIVICESAAQRTADDLQHSKNPQQ